MQVLKGKPTVNGRCSIATFDYRMVFMLVWVNISDFRADHRVKSRFRIHHATF